MALIIILVFFAVLYVRIRQVQARAVICAACLGVLFLLLHNKLHLNALLSFVASGMLSSILPVGLYYYQKRGADRSEVVGNDMPLSAVEQAYARYAYSIKNLNTLGKEMAGSFKVREYFKEVGDTKDKVHAHIRLLICRDLLNVSAALGHSYEKMDRFEAIGIWYYLIASKFDTAEREDVTDPTEKMRALLERTVEEARRLPGSALVELAKHLQKIDVEMRRKYMLHLYEYASVLANIDKSLTSDEISFLNSFKIMQVSKTLEDMPASLLTPNRRESQQGNLQQRGSVSKSELRNAANASAQNLGATAENAPKNDENSKKKLDELIGLANVKKEISSVKNVISVQSARKAKGLQTVPLSYHYVFTGNPGTGKTTVARILADIYRELGVLQKGHLVECDRAGLVAGYLGQTAIQTNKVIDSALDGVLFIDEAYSLAGDDFGKEAINTLLKRMEDDRERLVVILAGYTGEMKKFMETNPGLESRFNHYIDFPDYNADELQTIFELLAKKQDYTLSEDLLATLKGRLNEVLASGNENFGNARYVRNLFERTIVAQANRLASKNLSEENLTLLTAEDLGK